MVINIFSALKADEDDDGDENDDDDDNICSNIYSASYAFVISSYYHIFLLIETFSHKP